MIIEFDPTSSWKHDFCRLETRFFDLKNGEWGRDLNRTPNQLHGNYDATIHRLHVDVLNQGLPLGRRIQRSDFDGDTPLVRLRNDVVAFRLRIEPVRRIELQIPDSVRGLDHLKAGE